MGMRAEVNKRVDAYCGIDVGTQGVRAALVADDGTVLGISAVPLPAGQRDGARHEQRPDDWWAALVSAVSGAVRDAGPEIVVAAVALDATSGTVLAEDSEGAATGPALMYDDARAERETEVAARIGASLWHELGYAMQRSWALPKALWLVAHDAVPQGGRIAHQSDHLVRRLTGHAVATDTSNALKTGADLRSASWPVDVFGELGLSTQLLPELVLPGAQVGVVGTEAAAATGLRAGTPVRAGMTDGCAAQIASGALAPGSWSSALGTTLVVKGATRDLLHDPSGAVYCHRHPDGGWLPGGASSSGAGVIRQTFGDADLDALTRAAAERVPYPGVSYPLAGNGERFPFVAAQAHGFVTAHARDDADRFAALCQGVAYVERLAYDVLDRLGADTTGRVALTGGATRNAWWNQLRTDVLGRTSVRPASAEAAVGMAVLAAAEPGELTATANRMVRMIEELQPDPARHAAHTDGYRALVTDLADRGWLDTAVADSVLSRIPTAQARR